MSDKARAAAVRLARLHAGDMTDAAADRYCSWRAGDDERVVVAAYLAEHPADDAEPVTEEWWRERGFATDETHTLPGVSAPLPLVGRLFWRPTAPEWAFIVIRPSDAPGRPNAVRVSTANRGVARRLLTALGVPSKEGV